jgi:hypothetical protein
MRFKKTKHPELMVIQGVLKRISIKLVGSKIP